MSQLKKSIVWEYFKTPFQKEMDEQESDFEEETPYDDGYQDMEMSKKVSYVLTPNGQIVPTKMYIPPDKSFKMWIGHTNFDVDSETAKLMDSAPGVEALKVLSRYRVLVGIAKNPSFKDAEVCANIQRLVCGEPEESPKEA